MRPVSGGVSVPCEQSAQRSGAASPHQIAQQVLVDNGCHARAGRVAAQHRATGHPMASTGFATRACALNSPESTRRE
eukprot:1871797-Prymnesium_polylepis.1